jgi:hypothetical protein
MVAGLFFIEEYGIVMVSERSPCINSIPLFNTGMCINLVARLGKVGQPEVTINASSLVIFLHVAAMVDRTIDMAAHSCRETKVKPYRAEQA